MSNKYKVNPKQLFRQGNDIRKYLRVDMSDDLKKYWESEAVDVDNVLRDSKIYVLMTDLPETIEVEIVEEVE